MPMPAHDRISGLSDHANIHNVLLRDRSELGMLLTQVQPGGLGIILGVGHGSFVLQLLNSWSGGLYLVDPYIHIYKGYDDPANVDDKTHQWIYEQVRTELHKRFENRHVMVRDFSHSFSEVWISKSMPRPTFVYVDNNHSEVAVKRDLEAWWDILAPGGIMAGSTYVNDAPANIGVKKAVDAWCSDSMHQCFVYTTANDSGRGDWIIFKPL